MKAGRAHCSTGTLLQVLAVSQTMFSQSDAAEAQDGDYAYQVRRL